MAIIVLQDDINVLTSVLAAALQGIDSSGETAPDGFQKLRSKLGTGSMVSSSRVACCHIPGEVSAPCTAAAPLQSQRAPLDRVPHPGSG